MLHLYLSICRQEDQGTFVSDKKHRPKNKGTFSPCMSKTNSQTIAAAFLKYKVKE
uniref:Uncharacterized protein n=1 Tax=Medicago truncatula TaxID=3880 RepID=I3SUG5_MEDTR|nr:unknown [Medicago truncatula]